MSNLRKSAASSFFLAIQSILERLIGLISTLILARVLTPEDFGIVALALIIMGLIETLSSTGSIQYLLKSDNIDNEKINTSFSINCILKSIVFFLALLITPIVTNYYADPRLSSLIIAFAIIMFVSGLENPSLAYLQREQEYGKIALGKVLSKTLSVGLAVYIAIVYESHWALVVSQGLYVSTYVVYSYYIKPYRPRLTLINATEQWRFSGWLIPQSLLAYTRTQIDTLIVSNFYGKEEVGSYHTFKYLSLMPIMFLISPISTPLLVELRRSKDDHNYFLLQLNASLLVLLIICFPVTAILYLFSYEVTLVVLGPNWLGYNFLFGVFAFSLTSIVFWNHALRLHLLYGSTRAIFVAEVMVFAIIYSGIFIIGFEELKEFVILKIVLDNIASFLFFIITSFHYTGLKNTLRKLYLISVAIPPVLISALLMQSVKYESHFVLVTLMINSFFFFCIFLITSMIFCYLLTWKTGEFAYIVGLLKRLFVKSRLSKE